MTWTKALDPRGSRGEEWGFPGETERPSAKISMTLEVLSSSCLLRTETTAMFKSCVWLVVLMGKDVEIW